MSPLVGFLFSQAWECSLGSRSSVAGRCLVIRLGARSLTSEIPFRYGCLALAYSVSQGLVMIIVFSGVAAISNR